MRNARYALPAWLVFALTTGVASAQATAKTVGINGPEYEKLCLPKKLCQAGFAAAVRDAREYLRANPFSSYTITIPAGAYDLSGETATLKGLRAVIDLSNIRPTTGNFTLQGAGSGKTVIMTAMRRHRSWERTFPTSPLRE